MKAKNSISNASLFSSDSMPLKKGKKILVQTEKELTKQICLYIKAQYPSVYFFTDPSGMFQKSWAAKTMLKNNRSKHAQLDLIILHKSEPFVGAVIELKRQGEKLQNKDGSHKSEHLLEQYRSLKHLEEQGYMTCFAIGFDEAKFVIDMYLKSNQ